MSDLMRYGIAVSPGTPVNQILTGWMNAWFVNMRDPRFRLRERMVAFHNAMDRAFGAYLAQLREELASLRKRLPQPTREDPFPNLEALAAVKELEAYIRRVESVRTLALSAPVPPDEYVFHGRAEHEGLLNELARMDGEIAEKMQALSPETIGEVEQKLRARNERWHALIHP
ncbi:hypothetical protein IW967_14480 [Alicyclobacillus mali]|uniref:Uncharacterized protein n=1 Tax=Alicyclobacillus mali (ex Roth et al. 2021) TaxID=1123961 RepID=A0ABS0F6X7_9BACL|nr:hypothetical protein [Alicyclobacillus mali (ex Roth et al. 2021)]MBF8379054.1 hypothetical protein [Alicyclobacillus mali (ex Roth et al. 2021)]MCL6487571.1 hypothetical protein [Alicyclobacillus mali (ex Roth et al. 2021)]